MVHGSLRLVVSRSFAGAKEHGSLRLVVSRSFAGAKEHGRLHGVRPHR